MLVTIQKSCGPMTARQREEGGGPLTNDAGALERVPLNALLPTVDAKIMKTDIRCTSLGWSAAQRYKVYTEAWIRVPLPAALFSQF